MDPQIPSPNQDLLLSLGSAWSQLEQRLDASLSNIKGISFAEYRLLRHLSDAPAGSASRVELAHATGRTPSGVTRALQPLEKVGFVETIKSERDARLALAKLTPQGHELVSDACGVMNDLAAQITERSPTVANPDHRETLLAQLAELSR